MSRHCKGSVEASHRRAKNRNVQKGWVLLLSTLEGIDQPTRVENKHYSAWVNTELITGWVMWQINTWKKNLYVTPYISNYSRKVFTTISFPYSVWKRTTPSPLPGLCLLWLRSWKSATFCLWVQEGPERWPPLWASSPAPCLVYLQIPPGWLSSALLPEENTVHIILNAHKIITENPFCQLFLWLSLTWAASFTSSMATSSDFEMPILSRSLLSTTYMIASVFE